MKMLWLLPALVLATARPKGNGAAAPLFDDKLFAAYEDGKHRRYTLLFAVNGGAFAVLKFATEGETGGTGVLPLPQLALGMAVFTTIICADICAFGCKMGRLAAMAQPKQRLFGRPGWLVLLSLWILLLVGWFFVYVADVRSYCQPGAA